MRERNFGFISWVAVFACCFICPSNSEDAEKSRQTFVIRYKDGEQTIPVTVVLDYKKQTEYVINMNPRTPTKSVTLYDFKQRTIAYKDLTNRECFLGRLTHETLNEENNALQDVKNPVEVRPKLRSLDPRKPALTPTEIRNIAGQKTAVFCRKMNTWLLVPEKAHSINKREVNEYEERTHQYHGHRSSQYSHYERQTRRYYRDRGQSFRRRSHIKQSEAESENGRPTVPVLNSFLTQSSNGIRFNQEHPDSDNSVAIQNHSSRYIVPQNPHFSQSNLFDDKENSRLPLHTRKHSGTSNIQQNSRNPPSETGSSSHEASLHPRNTLHDFNSGETLVSKQEFTPDFFKDTSEHFKKNNSHADLILDETQLTNERFTTTDSPSLSFGRGNYPNVHSSLVHLLPLYKPLGQEFDYSQETSTERERVQRPKNQQSKQQKSIESEEHHLPTTFTDSNKFSHHEDLHSVSHDPDVSINVLEIPKITKEFENIKDNESYVPLIHPENTKKLHSSEQSYPLFSRNHSESSRDFQENSFQKGSVIHSENIPVSSNRFISNIENETHYKDSDYHIPQPDGSITASTPIHSTQPYLTFERTTSNPLYVPSVHTAFQNSEDFNTFQIFPNYIENITPTSTEKKSGRHSSHISKLDANTEMPEHLVLTTENSVAEDRRDVNNGLNNPTGEKSDRSQLLNPSVIDTGRDSFISVPNAPAYKMRYQSALRDFKPDEIVINIENIPTHTPPPIISGFHQRLTTTIHPTVRTLSSNIIKSATDQRSEQTSATTWRSVHHTTRHPRRRVNDKAPRPIQNTSIPFPQRSSVTHHHYQPRKTPSRLNQFIGVNQFNSRHYANRRQFHYPSRPIPPSHVITSSDVNHLHHMSHLNNLPPGVSVHPRHPQAPFADMVHSNRPPTIPFTDNNQAFSKPHRQRHYRKKEKHLNSCCRLRGQSSDFQSCCKNGGPCCSGPRRRAQPSSSQCCSTSNIRGQVIQPKQIQPPVRVVNQTLPPFRTENTHRSEVDNKDRCEKEKMCRTLYESTQQVMVCRNARIEGC